MITTKFTIKLSSDSASGVAVNKFNNKGKLFDSQNQYVHEDVTSRTITDHFIYVDIAKSVVFFQRFIRARRFTLCFLAKQQSSNPIIQTIHFSHVSGYVLIYIPLTQLSFILAWSTFQAHVFAGNILNVGESASYPVVDGNIHLILSLLGLFTFILIFRVNNMKLVIPVQYGINSVNNIINLQYGLIIDRYNKVISNELFQNIFI
ncbi:Hypothetical_protein [Hexamita inflata]|uniref:Hypothetical_protein n=1 Tax=Hexamita inflata TaxID=28002 RepID=A0AA86R519_9EUKA|nr:Hypothetical protein HINF_LOCUS53649 [Hexamita inflata]